jgi:NCAIR mutase (PurE)-related protein
MGCDAQLSPITTCRADRTGFPEVIWGANKTPLQIVTILRKLAESDDVAVATRVDPQVSGWALDAVAFAIPGCTRRTIDAFQCPTLHAQNASQRAK